MTTTASNQRQKAYRVLYGSLAAIGCFAALLATVLPKAVAGFPSALMIAASGALMFMYVLTRFIPRCRNCGYGLFSVLEIGRVPVVVKSWVGHRCSGCGKEIDSGRMGGA